MARLDLNYDALGTEILNAPWMVAEMRRRANAGKAFAEAVAPYDEHDKGDHYKDDFEVSAGVGGGVHGDRAYGRLSNSNEAAIWVELGSRNNDAHHVLGRSLDVMAGNV